MHRGGKLDQESFVRDILLILKKYGLNCSRYAPPDMPNIHCKAKAWNGPNVVLITIEEW